MKLPYSSTGTVYVYHTKRKIINEFIDLSLGENILGLELFDSRKPNKSNYGPLKKYPEFYLSRFSYEIYQDQSTLIISMNIIHDGINNVMHFAYPDVKGAENGLKFKYKDFIRSRIVVVHQEKIISEETAKLAKEKGFDWLVNTHYTGTPVNDLILLALPGDPQIGHGWIKDNYNAPGWYVEKYSAPTLAYLQTWLRELHDIHCEVNVFYHTKLCKTMYEYKVSYHWSTEEYSDELINGTYFDSYDETLEKGLVKSLKLIDE